MTEKSSSIDLDASSIYINDEKNLFNQLPKKYDLCEEFIDVSTDYKEKTLIILKDL